MTILKTKHIAMLSGGRDSTAMVFYMLENGQKLDYVIFSDTGQEFDLMYDYLNEVEEKLKIYGMKLTRLYHKRGETFLDWVYGKVTRGKLKGHVRGLPMVITSCYWQRESKVRPFENWLKVNNIDKYKQYIGYTYSELKRSNVKDNNQKYPLIENKMCEADVDALLERINLVNPLYEVFERTGCAMCPYQKLRGFYILWLKFNDKWQWMKNVEINLMLLEEYNQPVVNSTWNIRYTLGELEKLFESGEKYYDVEAPKACECEV